MWISDVMWSTNSTRVCFRLWSLRTTRMWTGWTIRRRRRRRRLRLDSKIRFQYSAANQFAIWRITSKDENWFRIFSVFFQKSWILQEYIITMHLTTFIQHSKERQKLDREAGVSRGIDFHHVGNVVNFDFPLTSENYIHRVGRWIFVLKK